MQPKRIMLGANGRRLPIKPVVTLAELSYDLATLGRGDL